MGIYLFFADFNFLNNNSSNENLVGIRQSHSFDNSLKANIAKENKDNGIDIFSGSSNTFENNTAEKNGKLGFRDFTKDFQDEVANDYFNNKCFSNAGGGSDPIGLCEPQKSNEPPSISIISPLDDSTFFEGDVVTLDGIANDPEEGIFDGIIEWTLNTFDVKIGTGTPIQVKDFSQGVHIITATVTDSRGLFSFDSVEIEIKEKNAKMIIEDLETEIQYSIDNGYLPKGFGKSLLGSLEAAKHSLEKENLKSACGQLYSITNKINAQEGKKIISNQSQDLRTSIKKN